MKLKLIPSIIAKNQDEFDKRFKKVEDVSEVFHLDVMDGKFVKSKSLDFGVNFPRAKYEAHLMMKNPEEWIEENYVFCKTIIFHASAVKDIGKTIKLIKSKKRRVGIALNPKTRLSTIKKYLKEVDRVTIMSVEPGFYGAEFESFVLKKIVELRGMKKNLDIEIDGSINSKTIAKAKEAGANVFVVGSYLQKSKNVRKDFAKLKSLV